MDVIPQDVWLVIASFLDGKTKRHLRLASTKWFNAIKYDNFIIYFARREGLAVITERLSKYSWPIKLRFRKSKFPVGVDLLNNISKLTNLTLLDLDLDNMNWEKITQDQWRQLSTLSNLRVFEQGHFQYSITNNLWTNYPKLVQWCAPSQLEEQLLQQIKPLSNLEALNLGDNLMTTWPYTLIPYPEKLTRLILSSAVPSNVCSRLTNLKNLRFYCSTRDTIDLTYATSLEAGEFDCNTLPSLVTNTNLTDLDIECKKWTSKSAEDIAQLTKLQRFTLMLPEELEAPLEFKFMSNLKQLRSFTLSNHGVDTTGISLDGLYEHMPCSLKSLKVEVAEVLDIALLVHLDLEGLFLSEDDSVIPINSEYISMFSNLTSLSICQDRDVDLNSISGLTRLEYLRLERAPDCDWDPDYTDFLYDLTNLTRLVLNSQWDGASWDILRRLTKIQDLEGIGINFDSEDRLLLLTAFKNLTSLRIDVAAEEFIGIHLTALTSLQRLSFFPDATLLVHKKEDLLNSMPYLLHCHIHTFDKVI